MQSLINISNVFFTQQVNVFSLHHKRTSTLENRAFIQQSILLSYLHKLTLHLYALKIYRAGGTPERETLHQLHLNYKLWQQTV